MRIYVDESGTHGGSWFIIGMLFVPDHGPFHADLCRIKEDRTYFNRSQKNSARYKETHLAHFKSDRDVDVAIDWINLFLSSPCLFRSVVVDWSIWQGRFFGTPFEPDALKKRRAYKKWAEMLLHPEVFAFRNAALYLDTLRVLYGYDILGHLKDRFMGEYQGDNPWIREFQTTQSWKDANQCLQLCDLLVGCIYQSLVPSESEYKRQAVGHLYNRLRDFGVRDRSPSFWRGYHKKTLRQHFPKFSEWFWRPEEG